MLIEGLYLCGYDMDSAWYGHIKIGTYLVVMLGASIVIYATLFNISLDRLFTGKIFQLLGKYSMSIYIIHWLVEVSIGSYLFLKMYSIINYNINCLVVLLYCFLVTLIGAYFLDKLINKIYKIMDAMYEQIQK